MTNAYEFMARELVQIWPGAKGGGGFDWSNLQSFGGNSRTPAGSGSGGLFAAQFWTAAVNPSDRYVLTVPGSSAYRISPLDTGIVNLTVAGDWTACGFHGGCIEAAVMSGRLAAHALSGFPGLDAIVGYDHP